MVDSKEKTGGRPISVSGGLEGKFSGARVVAVELVMVVGTNKGGGSAWLRKRTSGRK